jgi:hypothetical protein
MMPTQATDRPLETAGQSTALEIQPPQGKPSGSMPVFESPWQAGPAKGLHGGRHSSSGTGD